MNTIKEFFAMGVIVFAISACGSDSGDGSSSELANAGKGKNSIVDGTYDLTSSSYGQGSFANKTYYLADNTFQASVKFDTSSGRYKVEFKGTATYEADGSKAVSGCTTGSEVYSFQLDDSNKVIDAKQESTCSKTGATSSIVIVEETISIETSGFTRRVAATVNGEPWAYSYYFRSVATPYSSDQNSTYTLKRVEIFDTSDVLQGEAWTAYGGSSTYKYSFEYDATTGYETLTLSGSASLKIYGSSLYVTMGCTSGTTVSKVKFQINGLVYVNGSVSKVSDSCVPTGATKPVIQDWFSSGEDIRRNSSELTRTITANASDGIKYKYRMTFTK